MNYYVTADLDALRCARCSSGYSQREIAERIGMSKIRYQNLENGKYPRTKVESAEAIAVVLQTDPEVIFPMFMSAKAAHDAAEAERVDAENLQAYAVVVDPDAVRSAAEAAGVSFPSLLFSLGQFAAESHLPQQLKPLLLIRGSVHRGTHGKDHSFALFFAHALKCLIIAHRNHPSQP